MDLGLEAKKFIIKLLKIFRNIFNDQSFGNKSYFGFEDLKGNILEYQYDLESENLLTSGFKILEQARSYSEIIIKFNLFKDFGFFYTFGNYFYEIIVKNKIYSSIITLEYMDYLYTKYHLEQMSVRWF